MFLLHFSDALRLGSGEDLFNFLADCVEDFVKAEGMENKEMPLGNLPRFSPGENIVFDAYWKDDPQQ